MLKRTIVSVLLGVFLVLPMLAAPGCKKPKNDVVVERHEEINTTETVNSRMKVE